MQEPATRVQSALLCQVVTNAGTARVCTCALSFRRFRFKFYFEIGQSSLQGIITRHRRTTWCVEGIEDSLRPPTFRAGHPGNGCKVISGVAHP